MDFKNYSSLKGQHSFLSASKWNWVNYDNEKIARAYESDMAKVRGTELHAIAEELIRHKIKLPRSPKTLNQYVNDAIGYGMRPEQVLFYSENCFGTTDSISFKKNYLRIHDLKTGVLPGHMEQLQIYAALFCLDYHIRPGDIEIELRLYQSDTVTVDFPDAEVILHIMDKIKEFDKIIEKKKMEEA